MEPVPTGGNSAELCFDVPDEHIVQSSRGKNWQGIEIAEIVHPLDDFALPAIPRHILVINLSEPAEIHERRAGRQGHLGAGHVVILPAGAPTTWHLERQGEVRHLHLYLTPTCLQEIALSAGINPGHLELFHVIGVADPQIEAIAQLYFSELRTQGLGGKLYIESLTNLLALHLLRHYTASKPPAHSQSQRLPEATRRQVSTFIEEHLAEDLSLVTLAEVARLSPYHFARLFKASTGLSPHQYVIMRRVERARLLLTGTHWSLATIAHAVGFAHESHLALHFKRLTGFTPKQVR